MWIHWWGQVSRVLVIANALNVKNVTDDENWKTPILPAFKPAEVDPIVDWVHAGGSLLLITDHMPFPGAVADLAYRFGLVWQNAFAFSADFKFASPKGDPNMINFRPTAGPSGGIAHPHPVFEGRGPKEAIPFATSFTGSAFRTKSGTDIVPLFELSAGTIVL
jgi:hypothetical protein